MIDAGIQDVEKVWMAFGQQSDRPEHDVLYRDLTPFCICNLRGQVWLGWCGTIWL